MRYWKFNRGGSSSYLMHHGIDGQRWGVRHGPPYPLDSKVSTGSRLKVKDTKTEKREAKKSNHESYAEKRFKQIASNKNGDLVTIGISDSTDNNFYLDWTSWNLGLIRKPFRTAAASMKMTKDDRIQNIANLSPAMNELTRVTGPVNYSDRVIERINNQKYNKYKGHVIDVDYDTATKTINFSFDDPDVGNHKPVSYKGAVEGSANYKDRLTIKTDDWGSPTDSSIVRDFYDTYDGEYLGSKNLKSK